MSTAAHTSRPTAGAYAWFAFMTGSWLVFAVLAASSGDVLADCWQAIRVLVVVCIAVGWRLISIPRAKP
jgi:hypothetical protein